MSEFNGTPRDRAWTATRKRSLTDFAGEWAVEINGRSGNSIQSKLSLRGSDKKLEGTYTSQFFGEAKAKNVRWEDDALKFDVTFSRDGNEFTFHYSAKPESEGLIGVIRSEFQGERRETPFTAKRRK